MLPLALAASICLTSSIAHADSAAAWQDLGVTDGVSVSARTVQGSDLLAVRGQSLVDVELGRLAAVLLDNERSPEWVDMMDRQAVLQLQPDGQRMVYQRYDLPWPISDRDYLLWLEPHYASDQGVFTLIFRSIERDEHGPDACCVRATVTETFWRLTRVDADTTRVEVEVTTDPRGSLPAWLVNMIQKDWPVNSIQGLERQARKDDIVALTAALR